MSDRPQKPTRCPRCGSPLRRVTYGDGRTRTWCANANGAGLRPCTYGIDTPVVVPRRIVSPPSSEIET